MGLMGQGEWRPKGGWQSESAAKRVRSPNNPHGLPHLTHHNLLRNQGRHTSGICIRLFHLQQCLSTVQPSQGLQSRTFSLFTKRFYLATERSCEHVGAGRFFPKPTLKLFLKPHVALPCLLSSHFSLLLPPHSCLLLCDPTVLRHIPAFVLHRWVFLHSVERLETICRSCVDTSLF